MALEKGAEVFRNVCCAGPVDMVLKIDGQYIPIDVKQKTWNGIRFGAHEPIKAANVWGVAVDPSTKIVSWYYKVGGKRRDPGWYQCPPGLETFWDD